MSKKHLNYSKQDMRAIRNSAIPASLMATVTGRARFDSEDAASVFFARELDYVKSKSYDKQYPQLTALTLFPLNTEADPGAETITYYTYDMEGVADIIDNYSTDLPRADVNGKPNVAFVYGIGSSYGYSVQEMRASRMSGKNLDARKAESAHYQIDAKINRIAWAGDPNHNILGALSTAQNIPTYTITAGSTTLSPKWMDKTADEIIDDVSAMYAQVSKTTKNVERPDTLVLPTDIYTALSLKRVGDTGETVLSYIEKHAPYLDKIVPAAELNSDSVETNPYAADDGTGSAVAFLFTNDKDKIELNNPLAFIQHPAQARNLETVVPCEARTAGVIVSYPMSALIAIGI